MLAAKRQLAADFRAEEIFSKSSKRVISRARTYQYSPARVWNPLNSKYFHLEFSKQNNFYPDSCKTDFCSDFRFQISSPKTSPLERIATTSSSWIISSEPEMMKFSSSTDSPLKTVYFVSEIDQCSNYSCYKLADKLAFTLKMGSCSILDLEMNFD